jgi:hypothetical protein
MSKAVPHKWDGTKWLCLRCGAVRPDPCDCACHGGNARCARRFLTVIGMILIGLTLVFWWPGSIASFVGGILLLAGFLLWFFGYITA